MLILGTTSTLLRAVTGSAGQIATSYSYVDDLTTGPTFTPGGDTNTDITTAATTTIVPAPAANTQRNVKGIVVANESASVANLVTIEQYDGTDTVPQWKGTLQPGERVIFDESGQWTYYNANGQPVVAAGSGQYIGTTVVTSASANFTTSANTRTIKIRGVAGGSGGGGCTSVAAAAAAAGGGGAGGYAEKTFAVTPNTAYAYTNGAAGNGASGAGGGNGGNSTFVVGGTTVTLVGATGAGVATAVTTLSAYRGGQGGTVSTNGDLNTGGATGEHGVIVVVATPLGVSGCGASSQFGAGGTSVGGAGNGNNATGFGAGGGGAMTGASAVRTGGNGTAGCWVIDEFT